MKQHWNVLTPRVGSHREALGEELFDEVATLLHSRGITTADEARLFLDPPYSSSIHNPFLFDDMERAVKRIIHAIQNKELITIYGDYDVDGVCASTILYDTLTLLGARVDVMINHRERDGYGLLEAAVRSLAAKNTSLMVTTDCGISNAAEIAVGNELGIDTIITDHHTVPSRKQDIPAAHAIIHPRVHADRYPFKDLAGGGTAFKLVQGLIRADFDEWLILRRKQLEVSNSINWEGYEKWFLDLVCMSTIADCVPLQGENRVFVRYGLIVLAKTQRRGLKALFRSLKQKKYNSVSPETIGFFLGPRINAASRMEHGKLAFELMTSSDDLHADTLAQQLEVHNTNRQKLTERIFQEARVQLADDILKEEKILLGHGSDWPIGLLGLVAGKLCNLYHRPVVLTTSKGHEGGAISGAGRSVDDFHLAQAFGELSQYFSRYGGHRNAGGFALKKNVVLDEFRGSFRELARKTMSTAVFGQNLIVDMPIELSRITLPFAEQLKKMEPFGKENARPRFLLKGVYLALIQRIGVGDKHLRLILEKDGSTVKAIAFSPGEKAAGIERGDMLDCVCEIDINVWNNKTEVQVKIIDMNKL